ncbi:MAG: VWA domain-containing protein [Rikenellaceae bacterium]
MNFASPNILWLLLLLIPAVAYYVLYALRKGTASIKISTTQTLQGAPRSWRYYLRHLPALLRLVAVALLIIAIARPQTSEESSTITSEGIDIVMAMDISSSMLARDFEPDRITAAKQVASQFVADRFGDRLGIVVFAGEAFTQSPLTTDQATVQTLLSRVRSGVIEDGTAIGDGLATAINRLRESDAKSKVVILLTDGVNNRGSIAPLTASQIAKEQGIKVYTIGVGKNGTAPYPRVDMYGNVVDYVQVKVEIDEKTLREISQTTGGEYFRATDEDSLQRIYDQINEMERSKVEMYEFTIHHEKYLMWAVAALVLLLLEYILKTLIIRRLP